MLMETIIALYIIRSCKYIVVVVIVVIIIVVVLNCGIGQDPKGLRLQILTCYCLHRVKRLQKALACIHAKS